MADALQRRAHRDVDGGYSRSLSGILMMRTATVGGGKMQVVEATVPLLLAARGDQLVLAA
jgi:hypothetical protein